MPHSPHSSSRWPLSGHLTVSLAHVLSPTLSLALCSGVSAHTFHLEVKQNAHSSEYLRDARGGERNMEKQKKRVFSLKRSHLFYWCYIMVVTTWRTEENKRFINAFLIMPSLTPSLSVSFSLSSVRSTRVWLMLLLSPVREKRATICSWTIISRHSCRLSVHIYDAEIFLTLILVYCLAAKKSNTEMPNKVN